MDTRLSSVIDMSTDTKTDKINKTNIYSSYTNAASKLTSKLNNILNDTDYFK